MPYKDKQKQREAIRIAAAKLRAKRKGIISNTKDNTQATKVCGNCSELKLLLAESEKQRTKLQIFYEQEIEKKRKKWRAQKKRLSKTNKNQKKKAVS